MCPPAPPHLLGTSALLPDPVLPLAASQTAQWLLPPGEPCRLSPRARNLEHNDSPE